MHGRRWMGSGVAVVAAVVATTATAGPAGAITDGEPAPRGGYEFAAALSMPHIERGDGTVYASACSGALVAPTWVVTAGHCAHDGDRTKIEGRPHYDIDVTVGTSRDQEPVRAVRVVQNRDVDVAVIELERPITSAEPIPVAEDAPAADDELVLAGWGSTDSTADPDARPDRLQLAQYRVERVTPNQMFARATGPEPGTSACSADSGAPFVSEGAEGYELVATEVNGPTCPHREAETTARSDRLADWIGRTTGTA